MVLAVEPRLDPLRGNSNFQELLAKGRLHCKQPVRPDKDLLHDAREAIECHDGTSIVLQPPRRGLSRHELGIASRRVAILFAAFAGDALQIAT